VSVCLPLRTCLIKKSRKIYTGSHLLDDESKNLHQSYISIIMVHPRDSTELISPFNIIFSCIICQKTIGDIYPDCTAEDGPPSHSFEHDGFTRPCKFWLTECTHLTCSEHLPDGGTQHGTIYFRPLTTNRRPFSSSWSPPIGSLPILLGGKERLKTEEALRNLWTQSKRPRPQNPFDLVQHSSNHAQ
jgi:hypothetical protein